MNGGTAEFYIQEMLGALANLFAWFPASPINRAEILDGGSSFPSTLSLWTKGTDEALNRSWCVTKPLRMGQRFQSAHLLFTSTVNFLKNPSLLESILKPVPKVSERM